jgi:predicted kinase
VYLLCGPSLAGKSTVCRRIVDALDAVAISADEINRQRGISFGGEGLPESSWRETLQTMVARLQGQLARGKSVVVDDTLCYRWLRDRFRQESVAAGAEPVLVLIAPPKEELLARHASLTSKSQRPVLSVPRFLEHLESFEWPSLDESAIDVSTEPGLEAWLGEEGARERHAT